MIYHHLRLTGNVSARNLGMNVKTFIKDPSTPLFQKLAMKKAEGFNKGFEPIPDVVIFSDAVDSDWRRRNYEATLSSMLIAIEVKASERAGGRLRPKEITDDIDKLAAHREEIKAIDGSMLPVMMIIDSAPLK